MSVSEACAVERTMSKAPDRTPWDGIIVTDPDTCFGKPRLAGSRLYIDHFLALIEGGASFADIEADCPDVTRAQLMAMMGFVRDLVAAKRNKLKSNQNA